MKLTDAEREECIDAVESELKEYTSTNTGPFSLVHWIVRHTLAHAESLLSSRATGAEVEIVIEEPSLADIAYSVNGMTPEQCRHYAEGFAGGIAYARRHATMRGGGE